MNRAQSLNCGQKNIQICTKSLQKQHKLVNVQQVHNAQQIIQSINQQKAFYHLNINQSSVEYQEGSPLNYNLDLLEQNGIYNLRDLEEQLYMYDSLIPQDPPSEVQTSGKVVVVGDIHGDLRKFIQALLLANLIDISEDKIIWTGRNTTVVQLGDVLDRGSSEIGIVLLIRSLDVQARQEGGAVYMLNGNHEVMNARSQFRSVTQEGFDECCKLLDFQNEFEEELYSEQCAARAHIFAKGGTIAKQLGRNPTTLKVNDILFAHGGVLPEHCNFGLDNLNHEVGQWFNGKTVRTDSSVQRLQSALQGEQSIVWNRSYSLPCKNANDTLQASDNLDDVLRSQDCRCLVVGHTPQKNGANSAFNGKVWRMDVGMSQGIFDLNPQVLQIDWSAGKANFELLDWNNHLSQMMPLNLGIDVNTNKNDNFSFLHKLVKQSIQVGQVNQLLGNLPKQLINI